MDIEYNEMVGLPAKMDTVQVKVLTPLKSVW